MSTHSRHVNAGRGHGLAGQGARVRLQGCLPRCSSLTTKVVNTDAGSLKGVDTCPLPAPEPSGVRELCPEHGWGVAHGAGGKEELAEEVGHA